MENNKKEKANKKIFTGLKVKYRMVVMNDQTLEEKASLCLTPLNVFVSVSIVFLTLVTSTIYLIAFTPLREYIPGYADVNMKRNLIGLSLKADSLQSQLSSKDLYLTNLRNIINGNIGSEPMPEYESVGSVRFDTIKALHKSAEDSALRAIIEQQDKYDLEFTGSAASHNSISSFFFFTPVKGTVISRFDPVEKHYGIDIVAAKNEAIKSTLDGTVVLSTWTYETGYIIAIQHSNNLFSLYKHNSALLKKEGNYVKAGEVIAIIGNSGETSTGPHLHFELWHNGKAINPLDYMVF
jgi:murein DD-endopeptidase MepM/ murein hydrolase activator NlpD